MEQQQELTSGICLFSAALRRLPPPPPPPPLAKLLNSAADHPMLKPLFAIRTHIHNFSQMRRKELQQAARPLSLSNAGFAAILGDSVAGLVVANGISNFLNIYNSLLVARLVLTWFPNSPPAIVTPLSTICDPYLNIFRGIIPPLGGTLDLSPILAFLVLNAFTSTAAALPAELPMSTESKRAISSSNPLATTLTNNQQKWIRRMFGNRSKNTNAE